MNAKEAFKRDLRNDADYQKFMKRDRELTRGRREEEQHKDDLWAFQCSPEYQQRKRKEKIYRDYRAEDILKRERAEAYTRRIEDKAKKFFRPELCKPVVDEVIIQRHCRNNRIIVARNHSNKLTHIPFYITLNGKIHKQAYSKAAIMQVYEELITLLKTLK